MLDSSLFCKASFKEFNFKLWVVPVTDFAFNDHKSLGMLRCKLSTNYLTQYTSSCGYSKAELKKQIDHFFRSNPENTREEKVAYLNNWFNEIKFGDLVCCLLNPQEFYLGVVVGPYQTINNGLYRNVRPVLWFDSAISTKNMLKDPKRPFSLCSKKKLQCLSTFATTNVLLNTLKQCTDWSVPVLRYIAVMVKQPILHKISLTSFNNLQKYNHWHGTLNLCQEHYNLYKGVMRYDYGRHYKVDALEEPEQASTAEASSRSTLGNSEAAVTPSTLGAGASTACQVTSQAAVSTTGQPVEQAPVSTVGAPAVQAQASSVDTTAPADTAGTAGTASTAGAVDTASAADNATGQVAVGTSGSTSAPDVTGASKRVALNFHQLIQDDMTHIAILRKPVQAAQSEPLADKTAAAAGSEAVTATADVAGGLDIGTDAGVVAGVGTGVDTGSDAGEGAAINHESAVHGLGTDFELQQLKFQIAHNLGSRGDLYNFTGIHQKSSFRGHGSKISAFMHSLIAARFYNCFLGEKMPALLTELLQVQGFAPHPFESNKYGYYTVVSKSRAFTMQDRFCLLVHPSLTPCDRETVDFCRSLLSKYGASYVVLLSWSGFTEQVKESIAREFLHFRLWTGEDLVQCFLKHYHSLSAETQKQVPLKSVWVLR